MKKSFVFIFVTLVLSALIIIPCMAKPALVTDEAGRYTEEEISELNALAEEISERYNVDVVLATVCDVPEHQIEKYTEKFYFDSGYGRDSDLSDDDDDRDGVILMFSYFSDDERYFDIFTNDYADYAIGDSGREYIERCMRNTDRTFYRMGKAYLEACDYLLGEAENGNAYEEKTAKKGMSPVGRVLLSLVVGAVAGLIAASAKTSPHVNALKSVRSQTDAANYMRQDSFDLTDSSECFLYANETRTRRESSGSSSGSRSHSGSSSHSGHHGSSGHRSGRI